MFFRLFSFFVFFVNFWFFLFSSSLHPLTQSICPQCIGGGRRESERTIGVFIEIRESKEWYYVFRGLRDCCERCLSFFFDLFSSTLYCLDSFLLFVLWVHLPIVYWERERSRAWWDSWLTAVKGRPISLFRSRYFHK